MFFEDFQKLRILEKNSRISKNVLKESYGEINTCCICGDEFTGYGNNPYPYKEDGVCCDACNRKYVIPARLRAFRSNKVDDEISKSNMSESIDDESNLRDRDIYEDAFWNAADELSELGDWLWHQYNVELGPAFAEDDRYIVLGQPDSSKYDVHQLKALIKVLQRTVEILTDLDKVR